MLLIPCAYPAKRKRARLGRSNPSRNSRWKLTAMGAGIGEMPALSCASVLVPSQKISREHAGPRLLHRIYLGYTGGGADVVPARMTSEASIGPVTRGGTRLGVRQFRIERRAPLLRGSSEGAAKAEVTAAVINDCFYARSLFTT
jgi:hypothetical protein